jgi:hypothetical protein
MKMRIRCILFGCWCDENSACPKCGASLYDADFIQVGKLDWIHSIRGRIRVVLAFVTRRCDVCNKRLWFNRSSEWGPYCCCKECYESWIPF